MSEPTIDQRIAELIASLPDTPQEAVLELARTALEGIEWSGPEVDGVYILLCPLCDQTQARGHSPDCAIGLALAAMPKRKGGVK